MEWIKVAQVGDLAEGEGKTVDCRGMEIALFNDQGVFRAIENRCPHAGGPLGEGTLQEGCVVCPWHQWNFNLETGCLVRNHSMKLRTWPTKTEKEDVFVAIS